MASTAGNIGRKFLHTTKTKTSDTTSRTTIISMMTMIPSDTDGFSHCKTNQVNTAKQRVAIQPVRTKERLVVQQVKR
jgi:hypothetical protein